MGALESAPIEFQPTCDVAQGGVLLALPALLAAGLLRYTPQLYQLPAGFYGIESVFLLLGLMALARIARWSNCATKRPASGANCWGWIVSPKCGPCARS
jgi:hypothetical protein